MSIHTDWSYAVETLRLVRLLSPRGDAVRNCRLQQSVDQCLVRAVHPVACASFTFRYALVSLMVSPAMYTPAIFYLVRAWSLYRDLSYLPDSDVLSAGSHAQVQLKRVLSILGRSHTHLGEVRKASLSFALEVQLRVQLAGTLWLSPRLIPHQLEFAQSFHLKGDDDDGIDIIQDVIASLDGRPTVEGAVDWLYFSSDSADDNEEDAGGEDHAPALYSLYRSLPRVGLCAWLLLGRCHVALGRYSSTVDYLARSRRDVPRRDCLTLTANVEFSYTVALAAREYCLSEARVRTIHPFINWLFVGPALSDAIIEFHLLRLQAGACVADGCTSGSAKFGLSFNAHSDVIDIWQIQSEFHHCLGLFSVRWYAIDPQYRDIRGYPVAMALSVPRLVFGASRVTICAVNFFCGISRSWSVHDTTQPGLVMECLVSAQRVAKEHGLRALYEDSSLFLAFSRLRYMGFQSGALYELKTLSQDQVDARNLRQCRWCNQHCDDILKCEGCRVSRFCGRNHQRMAWRRPFWDTTISHNKIFSLLDLCRSLGEHLSIHDVDEAVSVDLYMAYEDTLKTFLSISDLAEYEQHYDCRSDGEFDASNMS